MDKIKGGLADKKDPKSFDKKEVDRGADVEREHTSDREIAKEIARDHLVEDKKYYDKLDKMEKSAFWQGFVKQAYPDTRKEDTAQILKRVGGATGGGALAGGILGAAHGAIRGSARKHGLRGAGVGALMGGAIGVRDAMGYMSNRKKAKKLVQAGHDPKKVDSMTENELHAAYEKQARELTSRTRNSIPDADFALPGRRYPIHDLAHARNALARISQFGSPAEKETVRKKVHAKYPGIGD